MPEKTALPATPEMPQVLQDRTAILNSDGALFPYRSCHTKGKPKRVRICSLVTAEDRFVTWMTDVGPKGKPSGIPIPPLFIMAESARPLRSRQCHAQAETYLTTEKNAVSDSFSLSDCWVCTVLPRSNLEFPIWGIPSMNWTLTFVHPRNGTCPFGKDDREHLGERSELLPRENVNIYIRCLNDKIPCVGTVPLSYLALEPDNCSMAEYIGTFTKIRDYGVDVTICADKKDTNSGSHSLNFLVQICKLQKGFYWLCGDGRARKSLPLNWKGYCIGGYISP
ncbi:Female expressed transcript 1 [Aix galericulata]|nr:Female expressed transcript 1 [Aix galericulata]